MLKATGVRYQAIDVPGAAIRAERKRIVPFAVKLSMFGNCGFPHWAGAALSTRIRPKFTGPHSRTGPLRSVRRILDRRFATHLNARMRVRQAYRWTIDTNIWPFWPIAGPTSESENRPKTPLFLSIWRGGTTIPHPDCRPLTTVPTAEGTQKTRFRRHVRTPPDAGIQEREGAIRQLALTSAVFPSGSSEDCHEKSSPAPCDRPRVWDTRSPRPRFWRSR